MTDRLLIGTDEAGYGPNLGPLVVVATSWTFPESVSPTNLWQELADVLTDQYKAGDRRLFVADSKSVYSSGDSLESLEVPVLAFLRTLGLECSDIEQLATVLTAADFPARYQSEPWNGNTTLSLPTDSCCDHIDEWKGLLNHAMQGSGVRLTGVRTRILFPEEFNAHVAKTDSKGSVLSSATLTLVRELCDRFPAGHTTVFCDKHGGRNRYDEIIAAHFDDQFVFRLEESRERSRYRMGQMEFCFRTKAEALLPVALASMIAKYLREVLMRQFNLWWQSHVPDLKPTQGYPVDAKRFRNDISTAVTRLGIPDDVLWRCR
jgi:ribonuclease HII